MHEDEYEDPTPRTLLDAALWYARGRGWYVVPLHHVDRDNACSCAKGMACTSPGKHPRLKGWTDSATKDEATIRETWKKYPKANVGIAPGPSGLVVLDVDPDKGGDDSIAKLVAVYGDAFKDTLRAVTGRGGSHYYYEAPTGDVDLLNSVSRLGPGLDIKTEGGMVVAYPSVSGYGSYEWEAGAAPWDMIYGENGGHEAPLQRFPGWMLALLTGTNKPRLNVAQLLEHGADEGERNDAIFRMASQYRADDKPQELANQHALQIAARSRPPLPASEALGAVESAYSRYQPNQRAYLDTSVEVLTELEVKYTTGCPDTDLGNAERLIRLYGQDLRHCPSIGWLVWDGKRWARNDIKAHQLAKRAARSIRDEAKNTEDDILKKRLDKHVKYSESAKGVASLLALAATDARITVRAEDLDSHPDRLTVANGTIDLRTGQLHEHRREDLNTKISPVEFHRNALDGYFTRFLGMATAGDLEYAEFLQRAAGYTLTGYTWEEKLFLVLGGAATGKSSLLEALRTVLGEYAVVADFETFLQRRGDAGVRNDIARLDGARLVTASEADEGRRLNAGLVKQLTGGDKIAARHLYREYYEFYLKAKIWLAANHPPQIADDDEGMWRRVLRLPFEHVVPADKRDPKLKLALRDPNSKTAQAVLTWAVRGAVLWFKDGLAIAPVVAEATGRYRVDSDELKPFVDDCLVLGDPEAFTASGDLRLRYVSWCTANHLPPVSANKLGRKLTALGAEQARSSDGQRRGWRGVALAHPVIRRP